MTKPSEKQAPVRVIVPLPRFPHRHSENLLWMEEGHCKGMDPEKFFPRRLSGGTIGNRQDPAEEIINTACQRCPVADACFAYGRTIRATHGVFGGVNFGAHRRDDE